jgi:hypothetical protein
MTRQCSDCGTRISPQSVKGRCRRCAIAVMNADPAYCARRAEANRRKANDPAYRVKLLRNLAEANRAWRQTPEGKETLRELGRKAIARTMEPGMREKWAAGRAGAGRKRHETVMAWCPPEYRAEYSRLVRTKVKAAVAKERILSIVEQDKCARLARWNITEIRDFLSRFAPVLRKEQWLYGTVILSPEELARRALNKGWRPSDWSRAA